jgi:hypothetical protein
MTHAIYKDRAGNTAHIENKVLSVRNKEGKLVNKKESLQFLKKPAVLAQVRLHKPELQITTPLKASKHKTYLQLQ